jgi:DNA-binding MarR family transcriptional regulator
MVRTMKTRLDEPSEQDWNLATRLDAVATILRGLAIRDLKEDALTPSGAILLELAHAHPGSTSSSLSLMMGVSRQATSKAVQSLVALGLLEAKAHPEDARAQRISVSPSGRKALLRCRARRGPGLSKLLAPLDPKSRQALLETLDRLHAAALSPDKPDPQA